MKRPKIPEVNLLLQKKINPVPIPKIPFYSKETIRRIILIVLLMFSFFLIIFIDDIIEDYESSVLDKTQYIMYDYVKQNGDKSTFKSNFHRDYKTFLPFIEVFFNFDDYFYKDYLEINFVTNNFSEKEKAEIINMLTSMWKSVRIEVSDSDHSSNASKVSIYMEGIRF